MSDIFPPVVQRPKLLEFQKAIDGLPSCLRRDECGDWAIFGRAGHIYAVPEGFQLVVSTSERPQKWTWIKKRLSFCMVTQDGDDEGCLILDRIPSADEGELIRAAVGIPKARAMTEELLTKLAAARVKSPLFAGTSAESRVQAATVPEPA